ncbi:MAG TPA: alpha/beta family hydrolase [Chryseosolibacter sp.]|nr:alpha/beta family hydrolase [Chryseosolibacter sp.]
MKEADFQVFVSDSIGSVTAIATEADSARGVFVLAHGAGAGMRHPFLNDLALQLTSRDLSVIRYNFAYMERGSRRPDPGPVAERTVRAVIDHVSRLFPGLPVIASGKSFGGRMTSQLLCKHTIESVKALVFYGFPLHPPGSPGIERAQHLAGIKVPMLFLQGTRDEFARLDLIETVCKGLPLAHLEVFENANHSFKVGKKELIVDLAKKTNDWLTSQQIL